MEQNKERYTGKVKWFNKKSGYGFITVIDEDSEFSNKDIFVHYTEINVKNFQYKYLMEGEYISFNIVKSTNSNHEYQATNITGIYNGALMCETQQSRFQNLKNKNNGNNEVNNISNKFLVDKELCDDFMSNQMNMETTTNNYDNFVSVNKKRRKIK